VLVLVGVVQVGRRGGGFVGAGHGSEQVEVDLLVRRWGQRAPVQDDLARAGLVEVDQALVAQLLQLPGLEHQAAGDADARQRHRLAGGGAVVDLGAQGHAFAHAHAVLQELGRHGDGGARRRLRLRGAVRDGDRVRQAGGAVELELDGVRARPERAGQIVPRERVLATGLEGDRAGGAAVDDQRRGAVGGHALARLGVRGQRLQAEDRGLGVPVKMHYVQEILNKWGWKKPD
jgi:hypothetical protein